MNFSTQMTFYWSPGIYESHYSVCQFHLSLQNMARLTVTTASPMNANTHWRSLQKWDTRLPHPFSHPCPRLTANGLSKWPIAESLCNCVIRFHTFQSSNPIRMCRCVLRCLVFTRVMCMPEIKASNQRLDSCICMASLHVRAPRVEEKWS